MKRLRSDRPLTRTAPAWFTAVLTGVALPILILLALSIASSPLAPAGGPILTLGLMGVGIIGAATAGTFWVGVILALLNAACLLVLALALGMPAPSHALAIALAMVIASGSFAARGALFSKTMAAKGWLMALFVVAGEASVLLIVATLPGVLPAWFLALLPAQWASIAIQSALTGTGALAAWPVLIALAGTAATTLLAARLWFRRWHYLLMFSTWLGLSAVVYFWSGPAISASSLAFVSSAAANTASAETELVLRSSVQAQPLNPARGDASPKASVLWGDITKNVASGAIIEFVDGFSSPPHIHNVTYRGVVISGRVHNDDPDAAIQWMGPGSFWIQPAGEAHITSAADGEQATIFLEIMEGPYLVQPPLEAFDNGEKPLNLDATNLVWIDSADTAWIDESADKESPRQAKIAFLWGDLKEGEKNGTLLRLPSGFSGRVSGQSAWLRAVVIQGEMSYRLDQSDDEVILEKGSYFGGKNHESHRIACGNTEACLVYVSTSGRYNVSAR